MHEKESGFSSPKFSRLQRSKPCIITVTSLNVRCPRVSSRQFGQLTLLYHLSEQVDVMVMVFILGKVRDMVMVTDMVWSCMWSLPLARSWSPLWKSC